MTSENVDSPDFCPGCSRLLEDVALTEIQRWDGTIELIFCECGAALDLRVALPYVLD